MDSLLHISLFPVFRITLFKSSCESLNPNKQQQQSHPSSQRSHLTALNLKRHHNLHHPISHHISIHHSAVVIVTSQFNSARRRSFLLSSPRRQHQGHHHLCSRRHAVPAVIPQHVIFCESRLALNHQDKSGPLSVSPQRRVISNGKSAHKYH